MSHSVNGLDANKLGSQLLICENTGTEKDSVSDECLYQGYQSIVVSLVEASICKITRHIDHSKQGKHGILSVGSLYSTHSHRRDKPREGINEWEKRQSA